MNLPQGVVLTLLTALHAPSVAQGPVWQQVDQPAFTALVYDSQRARTVQFGFNAVSVGETE